MLVMSDLSMDLATLKRFCSTQLVQMLTHRPDLPLAQVLTQQHLWRSTHANTTLSHLMRKVVVVVGCEVTVEMLERVLESEEVNWECVLTLVSTALTAHQAAVPLLKDVIERNMRKGCLEQDMESLVVGLLFARHASQEGPHLFPTYRQWFSALFSSEAASPVATKQAFVFLIRFLTDLVPHEPENCLRSHLTSQVYTPRGCQELLQSYNHLVRARLQELRDKKDSQGSITFQQFQPPSNKAVIDEVEMAVRQFGDQGKIPPQVLEISMFRETYYRSVFLPALLAPRPTPTNPDALSDLIEALHSRGKITTETLNQYNQACQREASDLLDGVFMDGDKDIIMEEPIKELEYMLKDLIGAKEEGGEDSHHYVTGGDSGVEGHVLQQLSRVALKLEDMVKVLDNKFTGTTCLPLDLRSYNEKFLPYQMVKKILNTIAMGCHFPPSKPDDDKKQVISKQKKAWWVGQLLALVSGSPTLQQALYLTLLHPLNHPPKTQQLVHQQTMLHGLVLNEVCQMEGVFLPVREAKEPHHTLQPFTSHYLTFINLTLGPAQWFACSVMSSWLSWHLESDRGKSESSSPSCLSDLPLRLSHLYLSLAPRLPLVFFWGEIESEAGVTDVYRYLEGRGLPGCSALYYTALFNHGQAKIPLDEWVKFELEAGWEETAVNVRQVYLRTRALRHLTTQRSQKEEPTQEMTLGELVVEMVFALLTSGLKKTNSNDLLLLLQTLAQQNSNSLSPCLLEAWHQRIAANTIKADQLPAFMSVCRCLPSSYFLNGDRLLELSPLVADLVELLEEGSNEMCVCEDDVMFLCQCILTAAAHPDARDSQVLQCLRPLKASIVYHWESLSSFFENESQVTGRHECLASLVRTLKQPSPTSNSTLAPEEAALRRLSLCLIQGAEEGQGRRVNEGQSMPIVEVAGGIEYLKCLLAFIGMKQLEGSIPVFFPKGAMEGSMSKSHTRVVAECQKQMRMLLMSGKTAGLIKDILPGPSEKKLIARLVPIACVSILVLSLTVPDDTQDTATMIICQFELLLHCQFHLNKMFDSHQETNTNTGTKKLSRRMILNQSSLPDLDYLTKLYKEVMNLVAVIPQTALAMLPKATLQKCESELKSAVYLKLES